jgi:thioesterase domain-containing protein
MTKAELEQQIRKGIPLAAQMEFRILELSNSAIKVSGGATENINVHGTAFAGALYAICTLATWGLVFSRLPKGAELVMAEGTTRYRKPVVGEIVASCRIDEDGMAGFLRNLHSRGKGRIQAIAEIANDKGKAVEFSGLLFARLKG